MFKDESQVKEPGVKDGGRCKLNRAVGVPTEDASLTRPEEGGM